MFLVINQLETLISHHRMGIMSMETLNVSRRPKLFISQVCRAEFSKTNQLETFQISFQNLINVSNILSLRIMSRRKKVSKDYKIGQ